MEYGTELGIYSFATLPSVTAETSHSVSLTELSSGTTYYYRIHTYNTLYPVSISSEQSFTTTIPTTATLEQKLRGIWIIGGLSGITFTPAIGQVDLYDPFTDTWYSNVTTLPTPLSFAGAISYEGKIYVIGGFDTYGNVLDTVQIYEVASDSWSEGATMPGKCANIYAATVNDKIYVLGGTTTNAVQAWAGSRSTYEYNPAGDTWTTKANFSGTDLSNRFLAPFDDVVYNLGGRSAVLTMVNTHDGFLTTNNGTTQGTEVTLTVARAGMSGVVYRPVMGPSSIFILGGFSSLTGTGGSYFFLSITAGTSVSLFQYLNYPFTSPASWQTVSTAPYPITSGFGSAAIYSSNLYNFGGTVSAPPNGINNGYKFDLDKLQRGGESWQACSSMPNARYGHVAVTIQQ